MKPCYLVDIDGTVADITHRLHFIQGTPKNWDAFFAACADDAPIPHMIDLIWGLHRRLDRTIVFVTGRSDQVRYETVCWLDKYKLLGEIYMRKTDDHRPDHIVKLELLAQIRADGFEPIMAFEDRDQVVKMWRENGIPCLQVADGNF